MNDSSSTLIAGLAWLHLAFILVPLIIFTIRLEWLSLQRERAENLRSRRFDRPMRPHHVRV